MTITIGRSVFYTLTAIDAEKINRRRTTGTSIFERIKSSTWPLGAQAHIGNPASAGDVFPFWVTRIWPDEFGAGVPGVNGQVILDGNDCLWVTSASEGTEAGTWAWPPRV